ncbi:MAG: hypothetical protein DWQ35_02125 [Planctomycetota bacterium]|nr:MAG: hypothetical protein DWQ35_02125 [Planctomycetota bacterium]REK27713.1 MAG: hypothetical protein DWQ42_07045 [Planctomycetota bacterium]REK38445.1 MAG: hypothetical protein DWQ46_20140 [Planctomycetota bacterium]
MRRRDFVKAVAGGASSTLLGGCLLSDSDTRAVGKRVVVVAFDGLDPRIIRSLMEAGKLPNYRRLAERGGFMKIATSTPPHTPVAFSNIISGADASLHQVYDFIHRDPRPAYGNLAPFFSTSTALPPTRDWTLPWGDGWELPLFAGETKNLRQGPAFWDQLIAAGIDTDVYYVPSNYPATGPEGPGRFRALSGMGVPDLRGGYGQATFYGPRAYSRGAETKFVVVRADRQHRIKTTLEGPPNFLRKVPRGSPPPVAAPVEIVRDPETAIVKVRVGNSTVLLAQGEWSDWIAVDFPTGIPGAAALGAAGAPTSLRGMVRLYAKQVHPDIELYVSPINIDPTDPLNPISSPAGFCDELAARHGRYSTLGLPEDNKSFRSGALTGEEFLKQTSLVEEERAEQFRQALTDLRAGCLFFYFGSTDLVQHMFWRDRDEAHPAYDAEEAERFGNVVADTYLATDKLVGEALDSLGDDDTLIVFSDHGFTTFRRGFNLSRWLLDNRYTRLIRPAWGRRFEQAGQIDWSKTRAYGVGMNALYVNRRGREKHGVVAEKDVRPLLDELRDKLLEVRDDDEHDNQPIVTRVDLVEDVYPGADLDVAPDIIVGYADSYRVGWGAVLGDMPPELVEDNNDRWCGTHLIAPEQVPGMFFASRPLATEKGSVSDLAPTILDLFGVDIPQHMTGKSLVRSTNSTAASPT